jgi:hypothetical protein
MNEYQEFLESKRIEAVPKGIEVSRDRLNPMLMPFQADLVEWALNIGRAGLFCDCGLGKTPMSLDWARIVCEETGGNVLILAPLAVSKQTMREAAKFHVEATLCRSQEDVKPGINITNYEMLSHFDSASFVGVVLDESSILKSFQGKTKVAIETAFKHTPYKLNCSATPDPNDLLELLNQSSHLGIMPSNEALARWFIVDSMHMGGYRLKKHAVKEFWGHVGTWAACVSMPLDMGYDNGDFVLPELTIEEILVDVDLQEDKGDLLFRIPDLNATSFNREKRLTLAARVERAREIVSRDDEQYAVWCDTNFEADALRAAIPEAVEVRGSDSTEKKEQAAIDFMDGKIRVLISKSSIFGYGLNLQNCHNTVFCGMSFSYERFYQTVRRFYRFGQKYPVNVWVILGKTEENILNIVKAKERQHEETKKNVVSALKTFNEMRRGRIELTMDYDANVQRGSKWTAINGDCIEEIKKIESGTVGLSIYSLPFSNLYIYSDSYRDMGNTKNDAEFFKQYEFLLDDLYRVTMPGRICAVHCKNLVNYKGRDGRAGLRDFRGDIIRAHLAHGWTYHSEVCIWKDPVIEMQRTKAHGLLYKQLRKDSTFSRQGLPEYLVIFRKWQGESDYDDTILPVTHTKTDFELDQWQRWASPVWMDIRQTNVLNVQAAREHEDEKHIAPLQLDVIERATVLWSNPGDLVFSPFMGIGSEGYVSVKLNRRFTGIELKTKYFHQAIGYLKQAETETEENMLFKVAP